MLAPKQWESPGLWRWFRFPFLFCLIAAAALNIWVNPFGLYGAGGFKDQVTNHRRLKLELLAAADPQPTTLILGSSRVMTIPTSTVEEHIAGTAFNFGMTGAGVEDLYAALRLAVDELQIPIRQVVLCLDHTAFNAAIPPAAESRNLTEFREYFIHHRDFAGVAHSPVPMLISMEQTHASYTAIRPVLQGRGQASDKVLPSGQVVRTAKDRAIASGGFRLGRILDKRVRKYAVRWLRLAEFTEPDPRALAYLESLLAFCAEQQIEVVAYISTYHPRQWEVLNEFPNVAVLDEVNTAAAELLAEYGIKLHDFSRIESFGGSEELFYNEIHMRPGNQLLLIDQLLGQAGQDR